MRAVRRWTSRPLRAAIAAFLCAGVAAAQEPHGAPPAQDLRLPRAETEIGVLRAGAAAIDITPDPQASTVWLAGFGNGRRATGVHDPLWARAIVCDDGRSRIAVVACDLIGLFHEQAAEARRRVSPAAGVDLVVVCSLHDHEGPDTMGLWGETPFDSGIDRAYLDRVTGAIARAVEEAAAALVPVRMRVTTFRTGAEGFIRDSRRPLVYADSGVIARFVRADDGRTVATLVGWQNHPETLSDENTLVTSDFPHYVRAAVEEALSGTAVYVSGAVGGLMTPLGVTVPGPDGPVSASTFEKAEALGRNVARVALDALGSAETVERAEIRARVLGTAVPVANPRFLLASQIGVLDRVIITDGVVRDASGRVVHEDERAAGRVGIATEVGAIRIGPLAILLIPGEIYPEIVYGGVENPPGADFAGAEAETPPLDAAAREISGVRHVFPLGLASDEIGYLIPRAEWDAAPPWLYGDTDGPYGEVNSCGPDAAGVVHRAIIRCLREMRWRGY